MLGDGVRELALAPVIELEDLASHLLDDVAYTVVDGADAVLVDLRSQDEDGFILAFGSGFVPHGHLLCHQVPPG